VAIKKIMKPFSTPVLSKRTYRELKLLKHITHENVSLIVRFRCMTYFDAQSMPGDVDYQPQRRVHFPAGRHVGIIAPCPRVFSEVMGPDTLSPSSWGLTSTDYSPRDR
jgi:hypothetical protein